MSRTALTLAITSALFIAAVSAATSDGRAIAEYFKAPERVLFGVKQVIVDIAKTDFKSADALQHSLKYMKRGEILDRAAPLFEKSMTPEDAQAFIAFMATPLGQRVGETFRNNLNPVALDTAFASYSPEDQEELRRVFTSRGAANIVAVLDGPEWNQTWREYGEVLMCRYFKHEKPKSFANLVRKEKCPASP